MSNLTEFEIMFIYFLFINLKLFDFKNKSKAFNKINTNEFIVFFL